jgi:hypothetical protein
MAGMLAASVLADTFEQVTIIERHHFHLADASASERQDDQYTAPPALAEVLTEPARAQELDEDAAAIRRPEHDLARRLNSLDGVVIMDGCDAVGLASEEREMCWRAGAPAKPQRSGADHPG